MNPSTVFAGITALALTPTALAAPTELVVDNTFDGEAHVYVNGGYAATISGDSRTALRLRPGLTNLEIVRPGGFVLLSTRLMLNKGLTTGVQVTAPMTDVRLVNPTTAPLRIDLGRHDDVWLAPGTAITLPVRAGSRELLTVVRERTGERVVERRDLWVEPGRSVTERLTWTAPPMPSQLILASHHRRDLRVLIAGRDRGALRPGSTLRLPVELGRLSVQLVEVGGSVIFADRIWVTHGADTRVTVDSRRATRVTTLTHPPPGRPPVQRPGHRLPPPPPIRVSVASTCTSGRHR